MYLVNFFLYSTSASIVSIESASRNDNQMASIVQINIVYSLVNPLFPLNIYSSWFSFDIGKSKISSIRNQIFLQSVIVIAKHVRERQVKLIRKKRFQFSSKEIFL